MCARLQIVTDEMHLRIIDMVGMDELARVFRLHPVFHLRVGIKAEHIVDEREAIAEIEIFFNGVGECM